MLCVNSILKFQCVVFIFRRPTFIGFIAEKKMWKHKNLRQLTMKDNFSYCRQAGQTTLRPFSYESCRTFYIVKPKWAGPLSITLENTENTTFIFLNKDFAIKSVLFFFNNSKQYLER